MWRAYRGFVGGNDACDSASPLLQERDPVQMQPDAGQVAHCFRVRTDLANAPLMRLIDEARFDQPGHTRFSQNATFPVNLVCGTTDQENCSANK
jgi:hypothetical protein